MRRLRRLLVVLVVAATAALAVFLTSQAPRERSPLPPRTGPALAGVSAWGYQLQHVIPSLIPEAVDLLITDYSRDGTASGAWTADDVAALRHRASGKPRIVLAYLSIGEAETYRAYWRRHWRVSPPSWLGAENAAWKGNYSVRFWEPGWQRLIFDAAPGLFDRVTARWFPSFAAEPYLDRILAAGFDGVYLDKVDGFEDWSTERPDAARDMVRFVSTIAEYARARRPGFLVVSQNAEDLLGQAEYIAKIDAIAKEDLYFGIVGDGIPNQPDDIAAAEGFLSLARAAGLPVFIVEYIGNLDIRNAIQRQTQALGFRPLFASRELNLPPELVLPPSALPEPAPYGPSSTVPDAMR